MPISNLSASIDPREILKAKQEFVLEHFNETGITTGATSLFDVFRAVRDDSENSSYLDFLVKIMG